ncbi:MAG: hypothetical protein ACERKU_02780, partial [Nitrospirota bacterium]
MPEGVPLSPGEGNVQKSPSSKATAILAGGAYIEYVSTAKGRERRWRLFSTFPQWVSPTKRDAAFCLSTQKQVRSKPVKTFMGLFMGLLNNSFPWQIQAQEETAIISWRE